MKRIIICCDGTWNEPDQSAGGAPCPTNVVKLAALVPAGAENGIEQRLLYHRGIGAYGSKLGRWIEGATGLGISAALCETYRWTIRNYEPADEIYLFGFSRGAYTARSLAGFIRNSGILRPEHEDKLKEALALYRSRDARNAPRTAASRLFRQSYAWSDTVPIRCVGVWDTVGSLGVPNTFIQGILKHVFGVKHEFHDTDLSSTVGYAFQALAIDEKRKPFLPTLWRQTERGRAAGQRLEQCWFAGCHSDVGGGNPSSGLSDVALGWMAERARNAGLFLHDPSRIGELDIPAFDPDPCGPVTESMTFIYRLFGQGIRAIKTAPEAEKLEALAPEVRTRWAKRPSWRPAALRDYRSRHPGDLPERA